jgi:hypothetical protein
MAKVMANADCLLEKSSHVIDYQKFVLQDHHWKGKRWRYSDMPHPWLACGQSPKNSLVITFSSTTSWLPLVAFAVPFVAG